MKKYIVLAVTLLFLTLTGCQDDSIAIIDNQYDNTENILEKRDETLSLSNDIFEFPEEYLSNPLEYLKTQSKISLPITPTEKDDVTFGCVTFSANGYATINCSITYGRPKEFKDCTVVFVLPLACGRLHEDLKCKVCAVLYTALCDGKLLSTIGYIKNCNDN